VYVTYGTGYTLDGIIYSEVTKRWTAAGKEFTAMMPAVKAALR